MKKTRIFLFTILFIFLFAIIGVGGLFCYIKVNLKPLNSNKTECQVVIPSGTSTMAVAGMLQNQGMIKNQRIFYYYARFKKITVKAGTYRVNSSMSVDEILTLLDSGEQEYISISIPEGYTIKQIASILDEAGITDRDSFISCAEDKTLLAEYSIPAHSFEGYLFPETYYLNLNTPAEKVIRLLADTFFDRISTIEGLSDMSPDDLFWVVRLASIVEKEYRVPEEAPVIASVFTNRLNTIEHGHSWGLYSCATVVYIITDILDQPHPSKITRADTQIDNPYNTYKYEGLPPGAISNPGLTALKAAAHPANTKYTYFTLVDAEKGSHAFSTNNEDHIELKYEYTVKQ